MTGATGSAKPGGVGATGATGATATGSTNPAAFTGQINPTSTIHNPPPSVPSINRLTAGQIGAFGTIVVDLILAQVAFALGGVNILGVKPFSFLTDWGNALVKQAEDAYKNSFVIVDVVAQNPVGTTTTGTLNAVYSAAAAVRNTATTASENADTANGNVQTTWNALWDGAKGTTGSTAKTAADVKSAVLDVRNTGISADGKAQDTIDGIYSAVVGGDYTGMPASYVKPQLTGLTYTARNNVASGSNLIVDPGAENASYWTGQTGVTRSTAYKRSGSGSAALTSAGSTERTLFFNTIDTGTVQPYITRASEIYYVECYVYSSTAMGTVQLVANPNSGATLTQLTPDSGAVTSVSMSAGTWIKLAGKYTVPTGVLTASFGIRLAAGATTNGSVVYVDDMLVREITNAQTAQTNVESTWNQIYNGVYNLSLQGRSLTDVFNAMFLTKQTADGGLSAGTTAQGTAETAQGTANTANDNALTADQYAVLVASQNGGLVIDPDFNDSRVRRQLDYTTNGLFTGSYSTNYALTGSQSYKISMTAAGSASNYGGLVLNTVPFDGGTPLRWPVAPGQVYDYDIWVYCPTSNSSSKELWLWGGFTTVASKSGVNVGLIANKAQVKGSWDHWTGSFTIPALVNSSLPLGMYLNFGFSNNAVGAADESVYIDRVMIYRA